VARFYDPQLARFAQADNIIPEPGKSVSFDRYAYVKNNPILFNDPTGHKWVCTGANSDHCYEDGQGKKSEMATSVTAQTQLNLKRNMLSDRWSFNKKSGTYYSLSFSIGDLNGFTGQFTGLYRTFSIDFVTYNKKTKVFVSEFVPDALVDSDIPIYHALALYGPRGETLEKSPYRKYGEGQFASAVLGVSLAIGNIGGKSMEEVGVDSYKGPSTHWGGSINGVGKEYFSSNNSITGEIDNNVYGMGTTVGIGIPFMEGHKVITNSTPIEEAFSINER
jgi:hypothetical protein